MKLKFWAWEKFGVSYRIEFVESQNFDTIVQRFVWKFMWIVCVALLCKGVVKGTVGLFESFLAHLNTIY